ncbi:hypothetical protein GLO73106DRAFT_00034740 [Gloeocapsa sp. PCC 73106]|nr:hypothetical protein GLO73106DRAFT_00034740 [Gloeocapsa sp. PCC 73106]
MLCWHWQLLLATLAGLSIMQAIYLIPSWNWRHWAQNWANYWTKRGSNRRFSLAVLGGGITAIMVYGFSCIFATVENHWLATGIVLQVLLSLLSFVLLLWQFLNRKSHLHETIWQKWLIDLTDLDPLKRLIAVRQLTNLAGEKKLDGTQLLQLREYLELMLLTETEPLIRQAILTGFTVPVNIPLQMPLKFKTSSFSGNQR